MINDIVADMLTRIRNANLAKHQIVQVPCTNISLSIAKVLQSEGFIYKYERIKQNQREHIVISLKYCGKTKKGTITELKRVSKPGLKIYSKCRNIPKVLGGIGVAIISTSKGVMTDRNARQIGLGGEILCYIW